MPYEQSIGLLDEESVLAECGPMRLVIRAWDKGRPQIDLCHKAAEQSFSFLERIASLRPMLSLPVMEVETLPDDALARQMIQSVQAIGDCDLTPMAAVAGTIADAVADWLFMQGMTKVLVDNGGDLSIRLSDSEKATVGIRPDINSPGISHVLRLDLQNSSWGVTTSGLGGRSFTRGIASAVTAVAEGASVADAAATAIANVCFVKDSGIRQIPAEQIEPNTDLKGIMVTVEVGALSRNKILQAVKPALEKAEELSRSGTILGAFIALHDYFKITKGLEGFIEPIDSERV